MGYKVLGQSAPAATTATDLYTVPAETQTICSTLAICNRSATATSFRVAVRPAGATLATLHYLSYDAVIGANETIALTLGISLSAADVVTVYTTLATTSFSLFGFEI